MGRSGYVERCNDWEWICWRGAVRAAMRGKRGLAFLRELESALVALPRQRLIQGELCSEENGNVDVCAIGSVLLARRLKAGESPSAAAKAIRVLDPYDAGVIADEAGIARAMACELAELNDEGGGGETDEQRYERILRYVRAEIDVASQKAKEEPKK